MSLTCLQYSGKKWNQQDISASTFKVIFYILCLVLLLTFSVRNRKGWLSTWRCASRGTILCAAGDPHLRAVLSCDEFRYSKFVESIEICWKPLKTWQGTNAFNAYCWFVLWNHRVKNVGSALIRFISATALVRDHRKHVDLWKIPRCSDSTTGDIKICACILWIIL